MWKRRELKKKTRTFIVRSYWRVISVCFIAAMLTSAYPLSATFLGLQQPVSSYQDAAFALSLPNSGVVEEILMNFLHGTPLTNLFRGAFSHISSLVIELFSTNISLFFTVLRTLNSFLEYHITAAAVFSAAGIFLLFLYHVFVSNILQIGEKRYFLENRSYIQTPVSKIFFLYKLRCLSRAAWIMFCRSFFQFLWNLTVIGGIIKHYEYIMIPFLLAENPKMSRKDAFFLSRQLMRHNKWKLFLLDLSFLGWRLLSLLTLGLLDFAFVNPYITGCTAELYMTLRRNYVLSRSACYEAMNDSYLEHVLSEDELLISKALYDDSRGPYTKISYFAPEQYPVFLYSVQPPLKAVRAPLKAERRYNARSCIFLFFAFSVFGWILETLTQLMRNGQFENHTLLLGPWIPLYGVYGVLILLFSKRLLKKPVFVFLSSLFVYAVLEYSLNLFSSSVLGITLRDYSEFLLNLNGRVSLGGCVNFALLGCAFLYYLAPRWDGFYRKVRRCGQIAFSVILCTLFAADIGLSLLFHVAF